MSRRLFVVLTILFFSFGVLLFLFAFTDISEVDEVLPEEQPVVHSFTAFSSMPPSTASSCAVSASACFRIAALYAAAILMIPCLLCICDANGRVLCQKRYARSFYPVFKQELACG